MTSALIRQTKRSPEGDLLRKCRSVDRSTARDLRARDLSAYGVGRYFARAEAVTPWFISIAYSAVETRAFVRGNRIGSRWPDRIAHSGDGGGRSGHRPSRPTPLVQPQRRTRSARRPGSRLPSRLPVRSSSAAGERDTGSDPGVKWTGRLWHDPCHPVLPAGAVAAAVLYEPPERLNRREK